MFGTRALFEIHYTGRDDYGPTVERLRSGLGEEAFKAFLVKRPRGKRAAR